MYKITRKFALILSLLLVLSQWLSLAHATEHLLIADDIHCQTCTLHHHFHSFSLDTKSCVINHTQGEIPDSPVHNLYPNTPPVNKAIRAPPQ